MSSKCRNAKAPPSHQQTVCPLCTEKVRETRASLQSHIGRHLEEIALASLPPELYQSSDSSEEEKSEGGIIKTTGALHFDLSSRFSCGYYIAQRLRGVEVDSCGETVFETNRSCVDAMSRAQMIHILLYKCTHGVVYLKHLPGSSSRLYFAG